MEKISEKQKSALLSKEISKYISKGYKLVDKNDSNYSAILHRDAEKTNHILHLLLTIVTCFLWLIIWGGSAASKKGAKTVNILVDDYGKIFIS